MAAFHELPTFPKPEDIRSHGLEVAWREFATDLRSTEPGVVVMDNRERWELPTGFDLAQAPEVHRLTLIGSILPGFTQRLAERLAEDPGAEGIDVDVREALSRLDINSPEPEPQRTISWLITGAMLSWVGAIEIWEFDAEWTLTACTYEREADGDYLPTFLGFSHASLGSAGVAKVIENTLGGLISPPDELSWKGLDALDFLKVASALGDENVFQSMDIDSDEAMRWAQDGGESGFLRPSHLPEELDRIHFDLVGGQFDAIMDARRYPRDPGFPTLTTPIDNLTEPEFASVADWFRQVWGAEIDSMTWRVERLGRYSPPRTVSIQHQASVVQRVPFPDSDSAPQLGEVLCRVVSLRRTPESGEGALALCALGDWMWVEGHREWAVSVYRSALASQNQLQRILAAGHFIREGEFDIAAESLSSQIDDLEVARSDAAHIVGRAERESLLSRTFEEERDIQNVLQLIYHRAGRRAEAKAAYERWRLLSDEYGRGTDVFRIPV
ncbi:MAG: hypothetical protein R3C29_15490 [Dehalococcoidia bacterium]